MVSTWRFRSSIERCFSKNSTEHKYQCLLVGRDKSYVINIISNLILVINTISVRENRRGDQEWTLQRHRQHWTHKTQDEDNKTITHKTKKMNNTGATKYGVNACAHEGKQFLLLIRHPPCYSFIASIRPIKVLSVIEERKHLRTKEKINFHQRYEYFVTVNKIVMTTGYFLQQ